MSIRIHTQNLPNPSPNSLSDTATAQTTEFQFTPEQFITHVDDLLRTLELPNTLKTKLYNAKHFALRVPRDFVKKMAISDANDPLLLQVLPLHLETYKQTGFSTDPLGEKTANTQVSIIHKYRSRLLLTLTGSCAIHCRYCFRQHFDYQTNLPKTDDWQHIKTYIASKPDICEVVLSGGDPLMLTNSRLAHALNQLESLPQLTTVRIHSRVPVVIPNRLDTELLSLLKSTRLNTVLVIHSNHPNEIDALTAKKLLTYKRSGITLLNQSVLLTGINDDAQVLATLSQKLFNAGVLPYYLHLLDKVAGAGHFDVRKTRAQQIYADLQVLLAGYLVPKLVCEEAGKPHKTLIHP